MMSGSSGRSRWMVITGPCCSASGVAEQARLPRAPRRKSHFHQMQLASPHEVDQGLHHAVEPVNFVADDVHMAAGIGIQLHQLVLQQLQMQDDGIDGILYFVGNAAGYASAGRKGGGTSRFLSPMRRTDSASRMILSKAPI